MTSKILDGKSISLKIRNNLKAQIQQIVSSTGIVPGLATVVTVDDDAVNAYVRNKDRVCRETGIYTENHIMLNDSSTEDVVKLIHKLNSDNNVSGILIQLPLRDGLNASAIFDAISPKKDVDGLTCVNTGLLHSNEQCLIPCTAKGIIRLIEYTGFDICGKHAAVVGRSGIVGRPTAALLLGKNATVTICHSKTCNLSYHLKTADIIVSAVGKPGLITKDMVKQGAIVIDAGTTQVNGMLTGDVKFDEVADLASWITPVPGGVGSMTTTMLIENVVEAAKCL